MKDPMCQDMSTRFMCELLNGRAIMVIETKKDQEIIYYGDKILTENQDLMNWGKNYARIN